MPKEVLMTINTEKFLTFSKIDCGEKGSWAGKIFLTFDIDWAHDEVIQDTINLLRKAKVNATWFVTHSTKILKTLQKDFNHELGIHPNFNDLLNGISKSSSEKVLEECLKIIPNAKSVRSHSLTQNERLVDQFKASGLTHISNFFIPFGVLNPIAPFKIWDNMTIVPHCWQDNVALRMNLRFPSVTEDNSGLNVLLFHPIHIFLNTENLQRYEKTRYLHQNPKELIKFRYKGQGTRTTLLKLLEISDEDHTPL